MSLFVRRSALAAAALSALSLSACGGNVSLPNAGGAQALARHSSQSPRDASEPPATNPYPFAQGDVFNYAYTDTLETTTPGQPAVKSYINGTTTLTINGTQSFDGQNWTELTEVFDYTDTNSQKQTTATGTLTTDYFRNFVQNGNVLDYLQAGYTTLNQETDADGTTIDGTTTFTYASPYLIDIIPETKGAKWSEGIPDTESGKTVTTKSGSTETESYSFTRNADSSYTRTAQFAFSSGGKYSETDTQMPTAAPKTSIISRPTIPRTGRRPGRLRRR